MPRLHQCVLIASVVVASWLGMQAVHELGHVIGAYVTRGKVARVVLYPLTISRTDLSENPHPLLVVWAGPVLGSLLPLALWLVVAVLRLPGTFALRFFAGFSLIANGAYIGGGSLGRVGDCAEMLRHGSERWQLWLFGALAVPAGLALWHQQGTHFGLGSARGRVSPGMAYVSLAICLVLIALGFIVDGQSPKNGHQPTQPNDPGSGPGIQIR